MSAQKTIVIGIGNALFCDEGVGCLAALYLEKNYRFSPAIDLMDGATLGFKLMPYVQEYDQILILDTVSIEDAPGSVYVLPKKALLDLGEYRKTAHEVEVVQMMEICEFLDKSAEVTVIGIVPEDIESVAIGLSPTIEKHFQPFITAALNELEKLGYASEKIGHTSLEEIIQSISNPSAMKEPV